MLRLGLAQMSASPARPLASASEIRFVGLRNRMEVLIEVILPAALGANHLRHRGLVLAPCLLKCERRVERVGIFHPYDRGQRPAVLADREPLDDVEFLGVRRTEGIDVVILAACEPDRVDHERVGARNGRWIRRTRMASHFPNACR